MAINSAANNKLEGAPSQKKHSQKPLTIVSLTSAGQLLSQRIADLFAGSSVVGAITQLHRPQPFKEKVQQEFNAGHNLIFICATGIVMRTLASVIADKRQDPAVIVLDERGRFAIPLLSGHEGGANHLADQLASALKAQLVLTTANSYLQPYYSVGLGCERGCSQSRLMALLEQSLLAANLDISQISCLASIDIKSDEVGMIALAKKLNLPFQCYSADILSEVTAQLATPSDYVYNTVGVYGVAESAALISAQQRPDANLGFVANVNLISERRALSELLLAKQKSKVATCAIARSYGD